MKRLVVRISSMAVMVAVAWTVHAAQETADVHQGKVAEDFLSTATIKASRSIGQGTTRPLLVTLEGGGVTHDAIFASIDNQRPRVIVPEGGSDFQDSWELEIAAYEIDRIIGLGMVPATVQRRINGRVGSLQWFLEYEMTEGARVKRHLASPDPQDWLDQVDKAILFDQLIANVDRHEGNVLITKDYKLRLIDHSRAFRSNRTLGKPDVLQRFSRSLLEGIMRLQKDDVKQRTRDHLSPGQIDELLQRRDEILRLVDRRIAAKGEATVLYR